ncbi:M14 family zinc carboxypeptidase [Flammeovirga sp. OC4]|uniref:M14 family zinc carboxypeptidase n=1 Tax=Flammeovirga sp. OC4 TaxID=1382345 RepID=UPI0005C5F2F0|nr:M14 family zinc carboxypeptidase [Flammeovirga sp. OC4]
MQRLLFYSQWICLFFLSTFSYSQTLKSPSEFLEYNLGTQFTYHHKIHDYLSYLSDRSLKVEYIPYGKTYEGRPLFALAVSSEENIQNIESIRQSNLQRAGFVKGEPTYSKAVIWLGYNVHGNEASGSEVAMKVAYELLDAKYEELLDDLVIIIDPCLNPDGRDRYVNNFRAKGGVFINQKPATWEHVEAWPTGRYNHYLFDLNRDWAWGTQIETKQRTNLYKQWYPQIFVDFHEMMPQYSYFFGPSADPIHKEVTTWQKKYQKIASEKYETYFQSQDWEYFTRKVFDLLYPSYGDSWTCFNGAVGFTFEQGGHGVAGLSYKSKREAKEITLEGRIQKHFETSILTAILASEYKDELLKEYEDFFYPINSTIKKFIITATKHNSKNIELMTSILERQGIVREEVSKGKVVKGYSYFDQKEVKRKIEKGDVVFSTDQKMGRMLKVLLEPKADFTDSTTYDLTAWSLPYAFGLDMLETEDEIEKVLYQPTLVRNSIDESILTDSTFFILQWESISDVKLIAQLMQEEIKVGYLTEDFTLKNQTIPKGNIVFPYFGLMMSHKFDVFKKIIEENNITTQIIHINDSNWERKVEVMEQPRIAILAGEDVNPVKFGSLWYYFDKIIEYPVDIFYTDKITGFDLSKVNTLILSDGEYSSKISTLIKDFIGRGGKVILLENAINVIEEIDELEMSKKMSKSFNMETMLITKGKTENKALGCILELSLPSSSLISKGVEKEYFTIKENSNKLPLLNHGHNIGLITKNEAISGYLGEELKKTLEGSSLIAAEKYNKGQVFYYVDNPLIRGFWINGMHLFSNSIFFDLEK